jgi:hypothetical protein
VERLTATVVDELDFGFGWISSERLRLTSHALASDGRAWLVDAAAAPELEVRIRRLGEPAGVIQLLDRHDRACESWARRLGVPHHRVPFEPVAGAPFEFAPVLRRRWWQEVALWWPERRVLVSADALGTVRGYFALGSERVGVHPLLRLTPPRRLTRFDPEHILCGHGAGVHEDAAGALRDAVGSSRRRLVQLPFELLRAKRR